MNIKIHSLDDKYNNQYTLNQANMLSNVLSIVIYELIIQFSCFTKV